MASSTYSRQPQSRVSGASLCLNVMFLANEHFPEVFTPPPRVRHEAAKDLAPTSVKVAAPGTEQARPEVGGKV